MFMTRASSRGPGFGPKRARARRSGSSMMEISREEPLRGAAIAGVDGGRSRLLARAGRRSAGAAGALSLPGGVGVRAQGAASQTRCAHPSGKRAHRTGPCRPPPASGDAVPTCAGRGASPSESRCGARRASAPTSVLCDERAARRAGDGHDPPARADALRRLEGDVPSRSPERYDTGDRVELRGAREDRLRCCGRSGGTGNRDGEGCQREGS